MSARTKARKRALDVLFASELRSENPVEALVTAGADVNAPDTAALLLRTLEGTLSSPPLTRGEGQGYRPVSDTCYTNYV